MGKGGGQVLPSDACPVHNRDLHASTGTVTALWPKEIHHQKKSDQTCQDHLPRETLEIIRESVLIQKNVFLNPHIEKYYITRSYN